MSLEILSYARTKVVFTDHRFKHVEDGCPLAVGDAVKGIFNVASTDDGLPDPTGRCIAVCIHYP